MIIWVMNEQNLQHAAKPFCFSFKCCKGLKLM
jgi:hypothetical protein